MTHVDTCGQCGQGARCGDVETENGGGDTVGMGVGDSACVHCEDFGLFSDGTEGHGGWGVTEQTGHRISLRGVSGVGSTVKE